MPVQNFHGDTFVAFLDISGFKELMKIDLNALNALNIFYQAGYNALHDEPTVQGFFVSDCGVLFARTGSINERLNALLRVIKVINTKMLRKNLTLTTSIAYGNFDYQDKLEFDGIEKNPIYGFAYVQAFLNNEVGKPKLEPGQCRLIKQHLPIEIQNSLDQFPFLRMRRSDRNHLYYYWNVQTVNEIELFEEEFTNAYKLKYTGMLSALKTFGSGGN
jgi:hypothetical protein